MERGAFFQFCRFLAVLKRLNLLISLLSIKESKDKIKDGGQNNIYCYTAQNKLFPFW